MSSRGRERITRAVVQRRARAQSGRLVQPVQTPHRSFTQAAALKALARRVVRTAEPHHLLYGQPQNPGATAAAGKGADAARSGGKWWRRHLERRAHACSRARIKQMEAHIGQAAFCSAFIRSVGCSPRSSRLFLAMRTNRRLRLSAVKISFYNTPPFFSSTTGPSSLPFCSSATASLPHLFAHPLASTGATGAA